MVLMGSRQPIFGLPKSEQRPAVSRHSVQVQATEALSQVLAHDGVDKTLGLIIGAAPLAPKRESA
jgi:hypothetical protein